MVLGFATADLLLFVTISLVICVTLCALAMEASVLFTPAFLFLFPGIVAGFPALAINEAIGLALLVEFFGYTSSVSGYWYRGQVDFAAAAEILAVAVPLAILARVGSYLVPADGLLVVFGLLLVALAGILYRAHGGEEGADRGCLLCGDAVVGMDGGGDEDVADAPERVGEVAPGDDNETIRTDGRGPARETGDRPYRPKTRLFSGEGTGLEFTLVDRLITAAAGAFAGLVGIAVGEISNTFLTVRKRVPVKISTGTSALVLHLTILAALAANLVILWANPPGLSAEGFEIPLRIGAILAPVVVVGGQIGSWINSRLPETTVTRALLVAYLSIGLFVILRSLP